MTNSTQTYTSHMVTECRLYALAATSASPVLQVTSILL